MKALEIQPARGSQRATLPAIMAAVSNLAERTTHYAQRATMATAIASCVVFFLCLGLMYVPGIVISGLITITCALFAPMGDDDVRIEQEGGAA